MFCISRVIITKIPCILSLQLVFVVLARKCVIPRFVAIRHVLLLDDPVPDFFERDNGDGFEKVNCLIKRTQVMESLSLINLF